MLGTLMNCRMKVFEKFFLSDKTNELVIRYYDESMITGKMTIVYDLKNIRSGRLKWEDVEADFADFNEFSRVQIRNVFLLIRKPSKDMKLDEIGKS